MKIIELQHGLKTIVDDEDYEWIKNYSWHTLQTKNGYYVVRKESRNKTVYMHKEIMERLGIFGIIDHKDRDKSNNLRSNLREKSKSGDCHNKETMNVYELLVPDTGKNKRFRAVFSVNGTPLLDKCFFTREEAEKAYREVKENYMSCL